MPSTPLPLYDNLSATQRQALSTYAALLLQWNQTINLIGKTTEQTLWQRHIEEGLVLRQYLPDTSCQIVDFGSGAGIPGMILAITTDHTVHLIEADQKKAAFLSHVAMATNCHTVQIHAARIETLPPLAADIVTARACAPLTLLLDFSKRHLRKEGKFLFLKGAEAKVEIEQAKQHHAFISKLHHDRQVTIIEGTFDDA